MCCLLFAMAMLLNMSPGDLEAGCQRINCERQSGYDCISAYGAVQVAQAVGVNVEALPRWVWPSGDAPFVIFAYPWAGRDWTPDGPAHAFYCDGRWMASPLGVAIHCVDVTNPEGTWWLVHRINWTGWAIQRGTDG